MEYVFSLRWFLITSSIVHDRSGFHLHGVGNQTRDNSDGTNGGRRCAVAEVSVAAGPATGAVPETAGPFGGASNSKGGAVRVWVFTVTATIIDGTAIDFIVVSFPDAITDVVGTYSAGDGRGRSGGGSEDEKLHCFGVVLEVLLANKKLLWVNKNKS